MEKQYSFDTEPVNEDETLTFMVGALPSPGKPYLNQLINTENVEVYLLSDGSGEIAMQVRFHERINHRNLREYENQFLEIILGLMSHDLEYVVTWVPNDESFIKLAEYFGFEETGRVQAFRDWEGEPYVLREMMYVI